MSNSRAPNRTTLVYAIAAFAALGAALYSALGVSIGRRDTAAVAYVNGMPILDAEYARARDAMQSGLVRARTAEDNARAMQILIDEELIVQEALRLELGRDDRLVRKNLIQALIRSVTSLNSAAEPDEDGLRIFYEAEKSLFSSPRLVTIDVARADSESQSQGFMDALQGGASFEEARAAFNLQRTPIAPRAPLGKVSDYLGGSARDAVAKMAQGEITGPIATGSGDLFIWLRKNEGGPLSFEQARDSVETEWSRRRDEQALEKYIARLRRNARIKILIDPETDL
jgi:parvulin-like peptidyl-prolyl cis-trans isomerase-like protein